MSVKARVVVLAAGTLESTRLLLNSKLANSSGVMGHYLIDQIYGAGTQFSVPEARDGKSTSAMMDGSAIIPRFRNINTKANGFIRGYALNVWSSSGGIAPRNFAAYGIELQKKLESYHGSGLSTGIMGEVLARYENHVSIDKTVVDAWNIPVLRIDTKYTDNEFNMARDAVDTATSSPTPPASRCSPKTTTPTHPATASTSSAPAAWATTPKPACSTSGAKATTSKT